jgi:hypothetical protein
LEALRAGQRDPAMTLKTVERAQRSLARSVGALDAVTLSMPVRGEAARGYRRSKELQRMSDDFRARERASKPTET